ncbi:MAG: VanZ family protein [Flavobacteriaceae bacterium]
MHIKNWLELNLIIKWLAAITAIGIIVLSLTRIGAIVPSSEITFLDKIAHTFAYLVLSFLWSYVFRNSKRPWLLLVCLTLFGVILEVLQRTLTDFRTFDYMDMVANFIGVLFGYVLFTYVRNKKLRRLYKKDL